MKKFHLTIFICALIAACGTLSTPRGQEPAVTPDEDVVKITTKLVQLDVVVTDKDGNQVPDLSADDFEILQDGKVQKITGISYVGSTPLAAAAPSKPIKSEKNAIPPPPVKVRPSAANRILTFIVDDGNCLASLTGIRASREGIEKFINEQMLNNDLVAIYRTRAGSSTLQQYTSDKAQLLKAAKQINWRPAFGPCGGSDGSYYEASRINTIDLPGKSIKVESDSDVKNRQYNEDMDRNSQAVGSIGVLRYVVRGLRNVPGRKIVFFISDGMTIVGRNGQFMTAADVLRDVTDLANRSSVVVNTVDNRGVFDPGIVEARDDISVRDDANASGTISNQRAQDIGNSQHGLSFLAYETGGKFYQGQNYLDHPIKKALEREKGYYLIAYEPGDETFKSKNFNKIQVKVTRPGLVVSTRSGFLPVTDEALKPKKRTGESELYEAILAPVAKPGLSVQLSAFFVNSAPNTNVVRSMFHLDGSQITFVDTPDGLKKANLDVVAVTLNEKNEVVDEFTRTHDFKVPATAMPYILKNGLLYATDVPIKKAGTYNFRVAVRDVTTKNLGTAAQIVQIPDLKKSPIFMAGLTMTGVDAEGKFTVPGAVSAENAISVPVSSAVAGVRRFKRGSIVAFLYSLYNARIDPATGKPKLTIQMNLYQDGKMILEGKPLPADLEQQADWSRISDYGRFKLAPTSAPGDYALQLIVKDLLADEKKAVTSGWVDFEITD